MLLLSVAVLPLTSKASTLTIYSNFNSNPGNLYNSSVGWAELGGTPLTNISAMAFTPAASYDLTQIDLAIVYTAGTNTFTLDLETGKGGIPSNTILQSWTVNNMPASGSCCGIDTVTSSGIHLAGGIPYWLVIQVPNPTGAIWNWNNTGAMGSVASSQNRGSTWQPLGGTLGAFDVWGKKAALPEPSVAELLGTAFAALLVFLPFGLFSTQAREQGSGIPIRPDPLGTNQPCPPRRCGLERNS